MRPKVFAWPPESSSRAAARRRIAQKDRASPSVAADCQVRRCGRRPDWTSDASKLWSMTKLAWPLSQRGPGVCPLNDRFRYCAPHQRTDPPPRSGQLGSRSDGTLSSTAPTGGKVRSTTAEKIRPSASRIIARNGECPVCAARGRPARDWRWGAKSTVLLPGLAHERGRMRKQLQAIR